jgi:hypothetical protein
VSRIIRSGDKAGYPARSKAGKIQFIRWKQFQWTGPFDIEIDCVAMM